MTDIGLFRRSSSCSSSPCRGWSTGSPRGYLLAYAGEGSTTWLSDLGLPYDTVAAALDLVTTYRSVIRGAVVIDPNLPATVSVATTLAGLDDCVATSAELAAQLGLPVVHDLRGRFADELAASTYTVDELWPRTDKRIVISVDTELTTYLRDYAVANRAVTVWLDHGVPEQRALIERMADDMPSQAPYLGWLRGSADTGGGESPTVETLSRRGVHVLAADTAQNLTVLGGLRTPLRRLPAASPPALKNKIYITLTYSDGDNLRYVQHKMRMLWDDPKRGEIPINWPIPLETPGRGARDAVPLLTEAAVGSYASEWGPRGIFQLWGEFTDEQLVVAGLPIARSKLAIEPQNMRNGLTAARKAWEAAGGGKPVFMHIFLHAWTMTPTEAVAVAAEMDDTFAFVRGDQFFSMVGAGQ